MDLGIEGTVALVTGASGGLGSAICAALGSAGARVAGLGRDPAALARTQAQVEALGATFVAIEHDLTQRSRLPGVLTDITGALGEIDILVNITGGPAPAPILDTGEQSWRDGFDSMVAPVIALTAAVAPGMRARGWGRIITCTSSGAISPIARLGQSNTLRSALHGWSKTLANEIGRDGVTSNIVVPGRIATKRITELDRLSAEREGKSLDEVEADSWAAIPIGRYGRPEEFGDVVAFLASRRASYLTGSVIRVDGGMITSA